MTSRQKTLAEELAAENELLRRRFTHATRQKRPMSMEEAQELCRRMDDVGGEQATEPKP